MPPHPRYLATAIDAAVRAGVIHRRYFRHQPAVQKKGPIDLVTTADLEAEADVRSLIATRFPDHAVLGEEGPPSGDADARYRWIVDPLDGTTNFAHGIAFFCISIALEIDGELQVAVVYDPLAEELFTAERAGGARLNGHLISVSSTSALDDALLCTGFPYTIHDRRGHQLDVFAAFLSRARAVRRLGSAALDLCYVAAGRFDGFWEEHLNPWDMAAGVLIVQEAGGRVSRYDGSAFSLRGGQIVASNGALHGVMTGVIQAADPAAGAGPGRAE